MRAARERTRLELEEISSRVSRTIGPGQAAIFAAQLLMLDDPLLARRTDELIGVERINADWALDRAISELHERFARDGDAWRVTVPPSYEVGHEAHFSQVTANFLKCVHENRLPEWEVPNMITKYATIMRAYELSH